MEKYQSANVPLMGEPTAYAGFTLDKSSRFHRAIIHVTGARFAHCLLAFSGLEPWTNPVFYEVQKLTLSFGNTNALSGPHSIFSLINWASHDIKNRHYMFQRLPWSPEEVLESLHFVRLRLNKIEYATDQIFLNLLQQRGIGPFGLVPESLNRWTCSELIVRASPLRFQAQAFNIPINRPDYFVPSSTHRFGILEALGKRRGS